jgi:hypothetical protein
MALVAICLLFCAQSHGNYDLVDNVKISGDGDSYISSTLHEGSDVPRYPDHTSIVIARN